MLTAKEDALNKHIMDLKRNSLSSGLLDPAKFIPAQHFFEVMDEINKDDLFKIIRQMPKGGVLHAHDTALCNLDFIIQLTYWDHLWQTTDASTGRPRFRFSRVQPAHKDEHWTLVKKERERRGATEYDSQLRQMVSLYNSSPNTEARDINAMWARFMEIFAITDGILLYKEAWSHYFLQALTEFSADEVRYLEVRSTLPKVSGPARRIINYGARKKPTVDSGGCYLYISPQIIRCQRGLIGIIGIALGPYQSG